MANAPALKRDADVGLQPVSKVAKIRGDSGAMSEARREQDAHDRSGSESLARVPEVAAFLKLSRSKVYTMMDAGELRYVKLGKSRRLRWRDVMELIEANTVGK